jgi:hypothetical protein
MNIKSRIRFAAIFVAATLLVSPQARAQCPDTITEPSQALEGSWGFSTTGFRRSDLGPIASAGRFVARNGLLDVTITSNMRGTIIRQESRQGAIT